MAAYHVQARRGHQNLLNGSYSSVIMRVLGVEPGSPAELIRLAALEILLNSLTGDMETG